MPRILSPDYEALLFLRPPLGIWHRWDVEPTEPTTSVDVTLDVWVNDGRWIIQCPCGGAQNAYAGQRRFFCVDCLNEAHGGAWVKVHWPKDHSAIDEVLAPRPIGNQHWVPGETVRDLQADNRSRGLPG